MIGARPAILGAGYFLAHTPSLVRYGSKPTRELARDPSLGATFASHLRSYAEAAAYPPNRAFLGALDPDALHEIPRPWYRITTGPQRWGPLGEVMPEPEFLGMLKALDEFDLLWLEESFAASAAQALAAHPLVTEADRARIVGRPTSTIEAQLARPDKSLPIYVESKLALKLGTGQELGPGEVEGYLPRGIRKPGVREKPGAERAIDMIVAKVTGKPWQTELPLELPELVTPAAPVANLKAARLALVTTGGLVPRGNPDRLVRGNSKTWHRYSLEGLDALSAQDWECVHRGFNTSIVAQNPNYILPLNLVRDLQAQGAFAELFPWFLSTSGVGTAVVDAKRIGAEMARELKAAEVDAALLVAT